MIDGLWNPKPVGEFQEIGESGLEQVSLDVEAFSLRPGCSQAGAACLFWDYLHFRKGSVK